MTFQWSRRTFRRRRRRRRIVERCSKHVRLFQSAFGISRERALPIQIERDETNSFLLSLLLFVWSGPPPKNAPRALGSLVYVYRRTRTRELGVAVDVEPTTDEQKTHADDDDGEILIIFFF